jgi:hypothetical protein
LRQQKRFGAASFSFVPAMGYNAPSRMNRTRLTSIPLPILNPSRKVPDCPRNLIGQRGEKIMAVTSETIRHMESKGE